MKEVFHMKKILVFLLAVFLLLALTALPALATDNGEDDRIEAIDAAAEGEGEALEAATVTTTYYDDPADPAPVPGEPLTWEYLATIAGATAATLLIVQFLKVPLDRVWKIPTRAFVYFIALMLLLAGTYFTTGLTVNTALLTAVNAVIVALTAYGSYEVTFARKNK